MPITAAPPPDRTKHHATAPCRRRSACKRRFGGFRRFGGLARAVAGLLALAAAAVAAGEGLNPECAYKRPDGSESLCRLEAGDENYLAWGHPTGDENAYRGRVALRYWFSAKPDRNVYFRFNTEFDWYLATRESGPVIGRTFNPGVIYRHDKDLWIAPLPSWLAWVDLGVEHRSNGQTTDAVKDAARARQADATGDHRFFDSLSRSSNFASIEAMTQPHARAELYAKLKFWYRDREHQVTWGELANDPVNIEDFDRVRFRYVWKPFEQRAFNVDLALTLGDQGLNTRSWDLGVTAGEVLGVPVYLRGHYGPMSTLANYTKPQRALGIGVVFRPWRD